MFGLLDRDLNYIMSAFRQYPEVEAVIVFGSRALGNFKTGSDVDLAVKGRGVDQALIRRLSFELNEVCPLPYFFDVVNYDEITNPGLREHIDQFGKAIYPE